MVVSWNSIKNKLKPGGFWWFHRAGDRCHRNEIPRQIFRDLTKAPGAFSLFIFFISWNHNNTPGFNLFFIEFHETTTKTLQVSTYFFIEFHETTNGFKFYGQKYPWNHQKISKKIMKPGHKKKKMSGFLLKPAVEGNPNCKGKNTYIPSWGLYCW